MKLALSTAWTLGLLHSAMAWSQSDPGYVERQRQMTHLHVLGLVEDWLEATRVPGAAIAVVEGDETLLLEGFGLADIGSGAPVEPTTTIFSVGDLVRVLTATAALKLAEQGELELDSDLSQHSGLKVLAERSLETVTPAQLLLHTAGIDQRTVATRARDPADLMELATYLDRRMPPRIRPPGMVSVPSAHGYALIGRLIEVASGQTFSSFLETALLKPLEMSSTTLSPDAIALAEAATGYRQGGGRTTAVVPDHPQTLSASTLSTTAADMANWMRVVLGGGIFGGRRILSTASLDLLLKPQFVHHDSLPGRTLAFEEGGYLSPRELYLASSGNGFSAVMVLIPSRRVGLFAAFNSEIDFWGLVHQILDPFDSPLRPDVGASGAEPLWDGRGLSGYWQDAAVSHATAEKLVSLVRQDRVRGTPDGALIWRSRIFDPAGSACFQERQGLMRLCLVDGFESIEFAAIGALVLEKLSWYRTRPFQIALWLAFAALFLAAGWPRASLPRRHPALRPNDLFSPRWPGVLARLAAALNFLFITSLAVALATQVRTGSPDYLYEIQAYVWLILSLPLLAAAFTAMAAAGLIPVWRSTAMDFPSRLRLTLLVLALVAFLPFLRSWNLLGFHI